MLRRLLWYFALIPAALAAPAAVGPERYLADYQDVPSGYASIPDMYMVQLHDGEDVEDHFSRHGIQNLDLRRVFTEDGWYHGRFNSSMIKDVIMRDPAVKRVTHDSVVYITDQPPKSPELSRKLATGSPYPPEPGKIQMRWSAEEEANSAQQKAALDGRDPDVPPKTMVQKNAKFNLRYICEATKDPQAKDYYYIPDAGKNVYIYIIDTGIYYASDEFAEDGGNTRAFNFLNYIEGEGNGDYSEDSHGTQVASIAGGKIYGVAKKPFLASVKVFNEHLKSSAGDVVSAYKQITKTAKQNTKIRHVINASLNASKNNHEDLRAVSRATEAGVQTVAAAGNQNKNAGFTIPCQFGPTTCVASINSDYKKGASSNYGKSVDIIAPGVGIFGACNKSPSCVQEKVGTSFAAPHVSGVIALWLSYCSLSTQDIDQLLTRNAQKDITTGFPKKTPNYLANSGIKLAYPFFGAQKHDPAPGGGDD